MSTSSVGYLSPQACVIATELLKQSSYQPSFSRKKENKAIVFLLHCLAMHVSNGVFHPVSQGKTGAVLEE